jgi:hypothetical protein
MEGHVGERIVVEAPRVGQPRREGEILEVIQGPGAPHYRVRWNDGRETIFFPQPDAHVEPGRPSP